MTSRPLATLPTNPASQPRYGLTSLTGRQGFSIAELLVAIAIISVLAGLVIGAVIKAKGAADRARLRADLQAVASALDQYANDFKGIYPMSDVDSKTRRSLGDHVLAWALIGPGPATEDGVDGPGFRTMRGGQAHQPYLAPEKFKTKVLGGYWELLDNQDTPIAYLPKRNTTIKPDVGFLWAYANNKNIAPIYDPLDARGLASDDGMAECIGVVLGDANADRHIKSPETLHFSGPFILISAGADKLFHADSRTALKSDDIYNFER
ncbi:MAG TPA: type II secretion system protein [Tepidisphaeraceae bacterium]|nr:type II secretion system protein [Tepidisphaeraceae bacterium]